MPVTVSHQLSATTPDNPTYEIKPSNWNDTHAVTFNAVGSEISGAFGNGGGVTFGLSADGKITASAPAGGLTNINVSAGTTSNNLSAFQFSNGSGVTFGLNGSTITASVQTNYLTTAMASNRGTDFVQATAAFAGTNASGTIASNGISVSVGNYITTAMASNRGSDFVQATAAFNGTNASGTIGSNGISVSVGNYITTARASTDAIGLNSALTANGVSMTANSSGLSLNFPAFLTTAALSNHSHGNPSLNLTNLSGTTASNSAGFTLSLSAGNYITTARASNDAVGLNTAVSNATMTVNSSGLSFDGRGYAGTGLSLTNATATLNSNGLQLSVGGGGVTNQTGPNISAGTDSLFTSGTVTFGNAFGGSFVTSNGSVVYSNAFLTTAAQSNHSHGNPTLALTNLTGTTASASNGFTLSLSAAAGGGGTESFYENVPLIHGTQTFNAVSSTMYIYPFNLDVNVSAGFIRIPFSCSVAPTTGGVPVANSTITGNMGFTHAFVIYTQGAGANSNSLQYFTSTSGTGSFGTTIGAGVNSSNMTVTVNGSFGQSGNQTNLGTGASYGVSSGSYVINSTAMSDFTGPRFVDIPFAQSLSPGNYWLGIGRSWSSANNSTIFNGVNPLSSNIFISQTNITWGLMGSATNTSNIMRVPGAGFFTTNVSLISTNSINAVGQISVTTSNLVPYFQLIRKA